jgi:plasmid stability protein
MTRTRVTTRLPADLAEKLAARAAANHRSANAELVAILTAALSGTPEKHAFVRERAQLEQEWCDLRALKDAYNPQPYKQAIRRLIDDSAALRAENTPQYQDLDDAIAAAEVLL